MRMPPPLNLTPSERVGRSQVLINREREDATRGKPRPFGRSVFSVKKISVIKTLELPKNPDFLQEANFKKRGKERMNKTQRKRLQEAQEMLDKVSEMLYDAMNIIEEVRDEEQEKLDNANEGQLATERFQAIEEGVDTLTDLYDTLEELKDSVDDAYNDDGFEL